MICQFKSNTIADQGDIYHNNRKLVLISTMYSTQGKPKLPFIGLSPELISYKSDLS